MSLISHQGKDTALSDDYGKDLPSVQVLQRKHEVFEVNTTVIVNYPNGSFGKHIHCIWEVWYVTIFTFPITTSQHDIAALEVKVNTLHQEARRLTAAYAYCASHVSEKVEEVLEMWRSLLAKSQSRKKKLVEAEQLQYYLNAFRDLRYAGHICDYTHNGRLTTLCWYQ